MENSKKNHPMALGEEEDDDGLPCVLVTNDDGIHAPGLRALVDALVNSGCCRVCVCAPDCDRSGVGHSMTVSGALEVRSVAIKGATAYEVSGTPVDCVSLSFCSTLFPFTKPSLVLSGINKGSNCGYHIFYSGTVAGAREALICGVPAMSLSLNWKRGESCDADFEAAAGICLPLIKKALYDLSRGGLPSGFFLNIDFPTCTSKNKGFKVTRQGTLRLPLQWRLVSPERTLSGAGSCNENTVGAAPFGQAASADGTTGPTEISPASKHQEKLHFRLHYWETQTPLDMDNDHDFAALKEGFVTVTPLSLVGPPQPKIFHWLAESIPELSAS